MQKILVVAGCILLVGWMVTAQRDSPTSEGFSGIYGLFYITNRTVHTQNIQRNLTNATCTAHLINNASKADKECSQLLEEFVLDYEILVNFKRYYNYTIQQPLLRINRSDHFRSLVIQTSLSLEYAISVMKEMLAEHGQAVPSDFDIAERNKPYERCFQAYRAKELYTALWKEANSLQGRYLSQLIIKESC